MAFARLACRRNDISGALKPPNGDFGSCSRCNDPAEVQGRRSEVHLIPIGGRPARKPAGRARRRRDHGGVSAAPSVALDRFYEPLNLGLGKMLSGPQVVVL